MSKPLRVLIIEDSEDDALLLLLELRKNGYEPVSERVETAEGMKQALARSSWDLIFSDYVMPRFTGLDALKILKESGRDVPFIIISGNIGEDTAVDAMKSGAHDYIIKGNLARLVPAVERELREAEVRRARHRIEEERMRLAAAVEAAADAVVITDAGGLIQYVNPAFEKITGYSRDDVQGRDLRVLDGRERNGAAADSIREGMRQGSAWSGRMTSRKRDGSYYEEECSFSPIKGPSGENMNYVLIKRDITEKLRFESIAQAVDTMNNIGYIFTGVRHEIGNPVNAVIMNLSLLKAKLDTADRAAMEKHIDRALENAERVEYILRSLRSFNLYEKPDLQQVDMREFVEKFVSLVSEDFRKKAIAIDTEVQADSAYIDPRILHQVLLNLFTNAADALKERKDPRITLRLIPTPQGMLRLQVSDNGSGIPAQALKNLFKPFHTSKAHGTGLGLVIVKKMLAMMNATVDISSSEGSGTVADILLPAGPGAGLPADGSIIT